MKSYDEIKEALSEEKKALTELEHLSGDDVKIIEKEQIARIEVLEWVLDQ